jgi:hypothetical protein
MLYRERTLGKRNSVFGIDLSLVFVGKRGDRVVNRAKHNKCRHADSLRLVEENELRKRTQDSDGNGQCCAGRADGKQQGSMLYRKRTLGKRNSAFGIELSLVRCCNRRDRVVNRTKYNKCRHTDSLRRIEEHNNELRKRTHSRNGKGQ